MDCGKGNRAKDMVGAGFGTITAIDASEANIEAAEKSQKDDESMKGIEFKC